LLLLLNTSLKPFNKGEKAEYSAALSGGKLSELLCKQHRGAGILSRSDF